MTPEEKEQFFKYLQEFTKNLRGDLNAFAAQMQKDCNLTPAQCSKALAVYFLAAGGGEAITCFVEILRGMGRESFTVGEFRDFVQKAYTEYFGDFLQGVYTTLEMERGVNVNELQKNVAQEVLNDLVFELTPQGTKKLN